MSNRYIGIPGILFIVLFIAQTHVACLPNFLQIRRAKVLYQDGQALLSKGEEAEAMKKFQKSLELSREAKFRAGEAHNLNEMAIIYSLEGDYAQARQSLSEALEIYRQLDMEPEISKTMDNIARTYLSERNFEAALEQYETLLEWDRQTRNRLGEAITHRNMGHIYATFLSNHEEAYCRYLKALELFEDLEEENRAEKVRSDMESLRKLKGE